MRYFSLLIITALVVACNPSPASTPTAGAAPTTLATATPWALFAATATPTAPASTNTPSASQTATDPPATATQPPITTVSATILPITESPATTSPATTLPATALPTTPSPTLAPQTSLSDKAEFVADVTVPDGSDFAGGAKFTKTWRIKNVGDSTWNTSYSLVFAKGTNLSASATAALPGNVPPGQTVDLSIEMTAPAAAGSYTSSWLLRNPAGASFGVGPNANEFIYAQIDVVAGGPTSAAAPIASTPSGPASAVKVTEVTLSVDTATITNSCPHTFVFTALMKVEGAGQVRYQLEASTDTQGFQFDLPTPLNSTFSGSGSQTFAVAYRLEMRDNVSGQAWLHILSPNDLASNKVAFSLTCPPKPTSPPLFTSTPSLTVTP